MSTVWIPVTCPVCQETEPMDEAMYLDGRRMICVKDKCVMLVDLRDLGGEG